MSGLSRELVPTCSAFAVYVKTMRSASWLLPLALFFVGPACTRRPSTGESTPNMVGPGTVPDASTENAAADPIVDLLHTVDCTVAVSSKVDNPRDSPEHLVDGKNETAWNGRTGDLRGSISFRVPKGARVLRVEITAGFDKVNAEGDLFTMNHRITKVRLEREGKLVKEASLDPTRRDLQPIDVDEAGGDFTRSGSRAAD